MRAPLAVAQPGDVFVVDAQGCTKRVDSGDWILGDDG
jgi:regulator of RNase E activity RraA